MRRSTFLLLGATIVLAQPAFGLPPPHDEASGVTCADCHQLHTVAAFASLDAVSTAPGTTTTVIDGTQAWPDAQWAGAFLTFTSGANVGETREVSDNTATTLSWALPLPVSSSAGDGYRLARSREHDRQALCQGCHNPTGMAATMPDVSLHSPSSGVVVGCGRCHDAHNVEANSGVGAGLIREELRWPTANTPVVYPAAGQPLVVGASPYNGICETCHTQTDHHRNDASGGHSHNLAADCLGCHSHESGFSTFDHEAVGAVTAVPACMNCHGRAGLDGVGEVHGARCELCHLDAAGGGPLVAPYEATTPAGGSCTTCHGSRAAAHAAANHSASPPPGSVTIFEDNWHDDAGWNDPRPYFAVDVSCSVCHLSDLVSIHADECYNCHGGAVETLGTWGGGCQQGACHASFHAGSTWAHGPYEDYTDPTVVCSWCHTGSIGPVTQGKCLTCHASPSGADTTPPVTSSDAQASYVGAARIHFSMTDSGKVGIGTTYHQVDGAAAQTGSVALVMASGAHLLSFWSVDQAGNLESPPKTASFTITEDTTPPVTTSNAGSSYWQGATITLSATDASTEGVKATYYSLDGAPTRTGRTVTVPAVSGTVAHTLSFWSEDWSGNVEVPQVANFTVTGGTATIRLVWGNSDVTGPPTHPDASAYWYIRRGGSSGPLIASGAGANPGWSGVDDIVVPVHPTAYWVDIWWWDTTYDWDDNTRYSSVPAQTPGEIIRLSY